MSDTQTIQHGFWYWNWGNIASVVGVMVSFSTLLVAQSARTAATQARDAANTRLLADELRRGEILVRDLAAHLKAGEHVQAELRAGDLVDLLRWILEYWFDELSVQTDWGKILLVSKIDTEETLKLVGKILGSQTPNSRDLDRANRKVDEIFATFVKVRAALEKRRNKGWIAT